MANFTIRIFKSWGSRDNERRWVNNYEVTSNTLLSPEALMPTAQQLVLAEQELHLSPVRFLEATVSTWAEDSQPYNPDSFVTLELAVSGKRDLPGAHTLEALDSNVCLMVKRQCTTGRSGKLFYRGCLLELDVEMGGDARFTISAGAAIAQGGASFLAYHAVMSPYLAAAENPVSLALISTIAGAVRVRPVSELVARGITIASRNHRYFDRAPSA